MAFRGDDDARKARIEALEKQLAEARREHDQASSAEREQEKKRDELAARVAEIERTLKTAKDPTAEPETKAPAPAPPPTKRPKPARSWWERIKSVAIGVFWTAVGLLPAYFVINDCRPQCAAYDGYVALEWDGVVVSATAVNVPFATGCKARVELYGPRNGVAAEFSGEAELVVRCGGRPLFEGEGSHCQVEQRRSPRGWSYQIRSCSFSDGDGGEASWSNGEIAIKPAGGGEVRVGVPGTVEAADSLLDGDLLDSRLFETRTWQATVVSTSGSSPVARGEACTIQVAPHNVYDEENCNVSVSCGTRTLRTALLECDVRRSVFHGLQTPDLTIDVRAGRASVSESGPGLPYRANLSLAP